MATITAAAGGGNWNTGGSWVGGVSPGSADTALLTVTSGNITIPTATTVACRSLDCTGYTGTFTFASTTATLNVGDASGGAAKFVAGMTLTLTGVGTIVFLASTASTTYALTTGGKAMPNLTVSAGASTTIQFADNVTMGNPSNLTLTSGILDTNNKTVTLAGQGAIVISGSTARTLTLGSSAISLSTIGTTWDATTATNLTVTANTATVTNSSATSPVTVQGGGVNYNGMTLVLSNAGTATIAGANTFGALTRTGTAAINDALQLSADQTVTGALTFTGNAAANRLWVQSDTPGTARTITCNGTVTATRADFEDITGAGSASWNLAAATGGSGDCGGNSGITFTTATIAYGVVAGNWSATATWSTSSGGAGGAPVPLPQDTVTLNASSAAGTYTMNMQRAGKDIVCTGFTRTLSIASNTVQRFIFGSLTLGSGMTFSVTGNVTLAGRGSHTLTMATKAFTAATSRGVTVGRFGGTYTMADAADFGSGATSNGLITAGGATLDAAGFNVSAWLYNHGTATVAMGAGTWTVAGSSGTVWTAAAGTTINASTSTISFATSASTRTFAGGGKTYGSLTYTVAGSIGQLSITGSNTFIDFNFSDASNARLLAFTAATTTTITGSFNVFGTAGLLMTITSLTAANHTLTKTSGQVTGNYLSISRSQAGGGANWFASNSVDAGNNTGWIFLEQSIFTTQTPGTADFSSGANVYTVGTLFTSTVPGLVRGIRWFTATPGVSSPTATGALYSFTTDTTGVQLATVTIGSLPAGQWIQALFATPVAIASGTRYVACVGPTTHFALTTSAFAAAGITNGYLTAPIDAAGAHNGKFIISATLAYPDSTFSSTNYFVDVIFSPVPQHSPIPRVIGTPIPAAVRAANW